MSYEPEDFVPQFGQDEPERVDTESYDQPEQAAEQENSWQDILEKYDAQRSSDPTPAAGSTPPFPSSDFPDTSAAPEPLPGFQPQPLHVEPADVPVMSRLGRQYDSGDLYLPDTIKSPARKRRVPSVVLLLAIGCVCLFGVGSLVMWAYLTGIMPPQLAGLADLTLPAASPDTPSGGRAGTVTPVFTVTPALEEPTQTNTPAVFITLLSSQTPSMATTTFSATPTRTPRVTATLTPTVQATQTSVAGTRAAPSVTPNIVEDGQDIIQAGVSMVYVTGGTFMMGNDAGGVASPVHEVILSPFFIDTYEVTNQLWAACVDAGACSEPGSTGSYTGEPYYGVEAFEDYPVIYVSWFDADAYCHWRGARLPTEAEWEMAARWDPSADASLVYPWGNDWDRANLNYCDSSCAYVDPGFVDPTYDDGWPQMAPVGSFPGGVSPFGAFDMAGNVTEWVADWYSSSYYAVSPAKNPTGPSTGTTKGVRGGAWSLNQALTTGSVRARFDPLTKSAAIGFRCAISANAVSR
ncbi:MAG: SUMF1/EgtB/PvdO family nonheme iron enzyme [Anaerolineae bacterium]|nr:SUMF1/EgtB/PvdO family nonheme iron enzyme [Anaerolineae bacterium]